MSRDIFTLAELTARTETPQPTLESWIKLKMLRPAGFTDERLPLFSEASLERIAQIRKLEELGYDQEEIVRIVRKVGLPREKSRPRDDGDQDGFLTVGSLAEESGVSPRTIKHWEDKGIIEPDRRSEGGFRLYSRGYIFLCKLIQDLQLFGYSLEEIKTISTYFRDFLSIQKDLGAFPKPETAAKLEQMLKEIQTMFAKMDLFKKGIDRWEDLLKKKKKEILGLKEKNQKRAAA
jgi:DNA-binding transcriptional MerR regulator